MTLDGQKREVTQQCKRGSVCYSRLNTNLRFTFRYSYSSGMQRTPAPTFSIGQRKLSESVRGAVKSLVDERKGRCSESISRATDEAKTDDFSLPITTIYTQPIHTQNHTSFQNANC
jgi:hypothetical protein